jgi:hypothetical protein
VIGWIGDFFRFWWALFYWNTRKTWFRLRGAERDSCPCQNYSDSGLALDSRCDAIIHWHRPVRFRRVCPLLRETPEGWRCGVDAERVKPFWGRALLYGGGSLLVLYLAGTIAAFATLRLAGYDISYGTLVWPPRWRDLHGAQEKLYASRAQQAMAAGNYREALMALEMVCQLNPRNYAAGLALANLTQVASHPFMAEHIYERLIHDVPEQRVQTAQIWFRTLLARSAYDKIKPLAATMLMEDAGQRSTWLHALLVAARASNDGQFLTAVLDHRGSLPEWCVELITIERGLLQNHPGDGLSRLSRFHRQPAAPYVPYYQVDRLLRLGRPDEGLNLLNTYGALVPAAEAAFLHLRLYRAKGWTSLLDTEYETLLQPPLTARSVAQFCAYLISDPDPGLWPRFFEKFIREGPSLTTETLPLYHATFLAAELAKDQARAEKIATLITRFTGSDSRTLRGLAELLQARQPDERLARILPLVPLPTEVVYAALEHHPAPVKK